MEDGTKPTRVVWWRRTPAVAIGSGLLGLILGSAMAGASAATPAATTTAAATPATTVTATVSVPGPVTTVMSPKPAKTVIVKVTPTPVVAMPGDGTYEVGVDIKPGTYVSGVPDSGNCYWARMGAGTDNIIANNNSSGRSVVTIAPGDKTFESTGCADWTLRR